MEEPASSAVGRERGKWREVGGALDALSGRPLASGPQRMESEFGGQEVGCQKWPLGRSQDVGGPSPAAIPIPC